MFKLHDKTRRTLTLTIFLLLGPALLLFVLGKVCSRHSVRTVAEWESLLGSATGKTVEIDSVAFPAPGVVRFSQMRIIDPANGETLALVPQWELIELLGEMPQHIASDPQNALTDAAAGASADGFYDSYIPRSPMKRGLTGSVGFSLSSFFRSNQPRYWHCEIPCVSCSDALVPQAKDLLLDLMARLPESNAAADARPFGLRPAVLFVGEIDVVFEARKESEPPVTLVENDYFSDRPASRDIESETIKNACFEFRPTAERSDLQAVFHIKGQAADAEPYRLHASRTRKPSATSRVELAVSEAGIATQLAAGAEPFFASFGPQSRYSGTVIVENRIDENGKRSRSLELKEAVFSHVTLDSLLGQALSFRLTGTVDKLRLHEATFRNSVEGGKSHDADTLRLEYAKGEILNARGSSWWPGLRQLVQGTSLFVSPQTANPPDTDVTFRNATFAFVLDSQGVRLFPEVRQNQNMPLLTVDNHCSIHWPDPSHVVRYDSLLGSLARVDSPHIPLVAETQYLISTLPISLDAIGTTVAVSPAQPDVRPTLGSLMNESQPRQGMTFEQTVEPMPYQHQAMHSDTQPIVQQHVQQWPSPPEDAYVSQPPAVPPLQAAVPQGGYRTHYEPPQNEATHEQIARAMTIPPTTMPPTTPATVPQQQGELISLPAPTQEYQFLGVGERAANQQAAPQSRESSFLPSNNLSNNPANTPNMIPQPMQSPYGTYSLAADQTRSRVVIPHISANANQVQTDAAPGAGFNSDAPTFTNPYDTQVANANSWYGTGSTNPPQNVP